MEVAVDAELFTEQDRIEAWRLSEAIELGCSTLAAERFAGSAGDLQALRDLVARGCQPDLAVEILR